MPPVLGPLSPSSRRLWSWAAGRRVTSLPLVIAKSDSSSPSRNDSTTISRPASPRLASSSMARAAWAASRRVAATTAPLPAARPDAFTTSGSEWLSMYLRASDRLVNVSLAAVGTRAERMTSLAKLLLLSTRAAAADGPNTIRPSPRSRSASPMASGTSGPMTTRLAPSMSAASVIRSRSSAAIARLVPSSAVPGLPGAQWMTASGISRRMAHARACSRPPPPTTSTRTR